MTGRRLRWHRSAVAMFSRWSRQLLALVCGCALALAAGEGLLYWQDWYPPPDNPPRCPYWDPAICALYERHPPYGYRLRPSIVAQYSYPREHARRIALASNRHGFRASRELDEHDPRPRVVVLGDSLVLGEGVEEHERFTDVLESLERRWRVDNLGMTGWGPDLMLRALERVGVHLRPAVVVLVLYTDDFRRVHPSYAGMGFAVPRLALSAGRLVSIPYPEPSRWDGFRLYQAARLAVWSHSGAEWALNEAILDRFRQLSGEHGFAPVLVFLPGRRDLPHDQARREWLRRYAERHATAFADLTTPLHRPPHDRVFIRGNPHYSPDGHRIVAEALRGLLAQELATWHARRLAAAGIDLRRATGGGDREDRRAGAASQAAFGAAGLAATIWLRRRPESRCLANGLR